MNRTTDVNHQAPFSSGLRFLQSLAVSAVLAPLSLVACAFEFSDEAAVRAAFILAGMEGIVAGLVVAIAARALLHFLRGSAAPAPLLTTAAAGRAGERLCAG